MVERRGFEEETTHKQLVTLIIHTTHALASLGRSSIDTRNAVDAITDNREGFLGTKIHVPLVPANTHKKPDIVDIGKLVDLSLSRATIREVAVQPQAMKLYTSSTTYTISH